MDLQEKVLQDCLLHAQQVLNGELKVDLIEATEEWDETLLRNVLEQTMMIKLALHDFEIITDEFGMLAGFIDHAQWQDCQYQPVTGDRIISSAHESGWLVSSARALSASQEGKRQEAVIDVVIDTETGDKKWLAGFNPTSNKIIYLVPDGLDPYGE